MLKITGQHGTGRDSISLVLEGRLAGPWVEELQACWRQLPVNQRSGAVIDLTGVTFIDPSGKALLTRLWLEGATLRAVGCLTGCIVEEITQSGRTRSSCAGHNSAD
jgi:ABC-type transporter Mla MlaB component